MLNELQCARQKKVFLFFFFTSGRLLCTTYVVQCINACLSVFVYMANVGAFFRPPSAMAMKQGPTIALWSANGLTERAPSV